MTGSSRIPRIACLVALVTIAGCARSTTSTSSGSADTASAYDQRVIFQWSATERLMAIRTRLDSLRMEIPQLGKSTSGPMRARLAALDAARDSVAHGIEALESAGDGEWRATRLKVADVLDSLEVRIGRLRDDLRKPDKKRARR
jgi:hypothetical protein